MMRPEWEPVEKRVSLDDVKQIAPLDGVGPLVYQGQQILLYIQDTHLDRDTLLHRPRDSRRFHIAECKTIEQMRQGKRFERYVMTHKIEGKFSVEAMEPHTREREKLHAELYVCMNCLDTLGLTDSRDNWPKFSRSDFFRDHETFFADLPRHTAATSPPGGYPRNWNLISQTYRANLDWTCEGCGVCLDQAEHRRLLHCHHRNGVTSDNSQENLQALCVECHAKQPGHGRYPPNEQERVMLGRLREQQGIPS